MLIDRVGSGIVSDHFRLTPQALYNWRQRGIPQLRRIEFAKLCADFGISTPPQFFRKFELLSCDEAPEQDRGVMVDENAARRFCGIDRRSSVPASEFAEPQRNVRTG